MKQEVYEFLKKQAEADKAKALASVKLLTGHPAGIGDHSTNFSFNFFSFSSSVIFYVLLYNYQALEYLFQNLDIFL